MTLMLKRYLRPSVIALSLLLSVPALAQPKEDEPQLAYFSLEPDITTNFFTPGQQLGYLRAHIDIMVASASDLPLIEHHQPLIRNTLVELIGQQTEETIKSLAGREHLRKMLVQRLNDELLPEVGRVLVADLLFTKYVYQ